MISALLALGLLALLCGIVLGIAAHKYRVEGNPVVDQINAILPQTQCGQCGYPGCKPYAEAIANGDAINKCPPGGDDGIKKLADLLGSDVIAMDADRVAQPVKRIAFIREDECIGCTKCIQACPVDAIVGAPKLMHTVITSLCTGCDLCVPPCPVDCIDMIAESESLQHWRWPKPTASQTIPIKVLS